MSEERGFENQMKRLEEIVSLLENGSLSLEESLNLYREGSQCVNFCRDELAKAKHEIEIWNKETNTMIKSENTDLSESDPF